MLDSLARFINYSPIAVIGFLNALHTFMYGIGYIFLEHTDFSGTVLAQHVPDLLAPMYFGIILTIIGIVSIWSFAKSRERWVARTSTAQGIVWLFVTLLYFLNGSYALGIAIGLTWSLISGYLGYAYKNRASIILYHAHLD